MTDSATNTIPPTRPNLWWALLWILSVSVLLHWFINYEAELDRRKVARPLTLRALGSSQLAYQDEDQAQDYGSFETAPTQGAASEGFEARSVAPAPTSARRKSP